MFTNKDFYGLFQLCLLLNPFQNGLYIFGWLSVRILLEFYVKQFLLTNIGPNRVYVPISQIFKSPLSQAINESISNTIWRWIY